MKLLSSLPELNAYLTPLTDQPIAFVPTMGNLHAGHLALVTIAQRYAAQVIVSIFVNPLQFGAGEDYGCYPRTLKEDCRQLADLGVPAVFAPAVAELYPNGEAHSTFITVPQLSELLCGRNRPGHFQGVTTIVAKLFNLIRPTYAVFGRKDYQQLTIIKQMVTDLYLPVTIIDAPIVREADGLALSSRNQYLTVEQRLIAPVLQQTLQAMAERLQQRGERDRAHLEQFAQQQLQAAGFVVDYVMICDPKTLTAADLTLQQPVIILAAAKLGQTRLIDNLEVQLANSVFGSGLET